MPRAIDRFPEQVRKFDPKVIVLSRSRVGTFSMYQAFKILGYTPYHFYETVKHGIWHMEVADEALNAKFRGKGRPYGKAEFDKWFAGYDVIIELSQFFVEELVEFYPDAKFILVERDLQAWIKSIDNSMGMICKAGKQFPLSVAKLLDGTFVGPFVRLNDTVADVVLGGKGFTDEGRAFAIQATINMHDTIKSLIPVEKLLVCQLDNELGWNKICPFLDLDIPNETYPRGNAPAEFKSLIDGLLVPRVQIALLKAVSCVAIPFASIGAWYYLRT